MRAKELRGEYKTGRGKRRHTVQSDDGEVAGPSNRRTRSDQTQKRDAFRKKEKGVEERGGKDLPMVGMVVTISPSLSL